MFSLTQGPLFIQPDTISEEQQSDALRYVNTFPLH
jgi:hypothetical protein